LGCKVADVAITYAWDSAAWISLGGYVPGDNVEEVADAAALIAIASSAEEGWIVKQVDTGVVYARKGDNTWMSLSSPLDADLVAIAALAGTTGLLRKTAANTWELDTSDYYVADGTDEFTIEVRGDDPTTPAVGRMWVNTNA